ncbi:EamA family transporter [Bacillus inaquosorum]|uniref:EamA family transporter n=2 Tax=Bacillus inaquosorum TaxID=483913 RepID=A0A9Q4ER95_9BACI|nr:EamA family transporter [Bacillus inaquosorum]MCY7785742.1 EamA family transporter [Bacillus inaquosorum]MCY7819995.1 EamA family transporter [Bacillus inaquosorum]MCY7932060.1 EamA family transporter [Bacillus inaquosorum]MCY7938604.1 EamA family transporter [Bacillus inaquosorum]MCY7964778.1 EamA family transporter [Bacillus inaquosorum]
MKSKIQFILSMIIFGTMGLVVRYIDLSSSETALLSSSIGCLFLIIVFFMMKKTIPWKLVKANAYILFLSGIALGGNWIFLYQSYDHTTLTNATLGYYFAPVFVMILSPFVLKEQLPVKKIVCVGIAIIGMLLVVGNGISASGTEDLLGIFFGLVAAAFYAALMLINKFIHHMGRLEITIIQLGITALLLLPYVFFTEGFGIFGVSRSSVPFIIILGIVNTGIGFWLFFSGMQKLKGQSIAMLSYVDPFVAILISAIILQEQMTIVQMLGGALLLGSTFVSENKSIKFPKQLKKLSTK